MGIFQTYEALTAIGLWRKWKGRSGTLPGWFSYTLQGVGAAMAALAILFPYYLAPLIWVNGSFYEALYTGGWNGQRDAVPGHRGFAARPLFWDAFDFQSTDAGIE